MDGFTVYRSPSESCPKPGRVNCGKKPSKEVHCALVLAIDGESTQVVDVILSGLRRVYNLLRDDKMLAQFGLHALQTLYDLQVVESDETLRMATLYARLLGSLWLKREQQSDWTSGTIPTAAQVRQRCGLLQCCHGKRSGDDFDIETGCGSAQVGVYRGTTRYLPQQASGSFGVFRSRGATLFASGMCAAVYSSRFAADY